jgi:1-deoxy-D-xylulose-5-phosphate synthase
VGADGATHAGAYDIAYIRCIPNMSLACPADERECRQLLSTAFAQNHPVAVRYPRGAGVGTEPGRGLDTLSFGKGEVRRQGEKLAILAFGTLLAPALQVAEKLNATVVNMRWVKPLDVDLLAHVAQTHERLVTLEDSCVMGGAGSAVGEALQQLDLQRSVLHLGLPDAFIEHGDPAKLLALQGLDAAGIEASIRQRWAD